MGKLITRVTTIQELKTWFFEILYSSTDKVTKATSTSVINGIAYAISKIGQKAIKDIAVLESQIFPDTASGSYLDNAAQIWYGERRLQQSPSSTFVRVRASNGTVYSPGIHKFISDSGIEFSVTEEVVVDINGYAYIPVRSVTPSSSSNVKPMTINIVNPKPSGHISCTNEFMATGGRDSEGDKTFRERVVNSKNIRSRDTIGYIEEVLKLYDRNIIRAIPVGVNDNYETMIQVTNASGSFYTTAELSEMRQFVSDYLSLGDSVGNLGIGVIIVNTEWLYIDVDFRCDVFVSADLDVVRQDIQILMSRYMDITRNKRSKVVWTDLLEISKSVNGVSLVPSDTFMPTTDITIQPTQFPRIRSFIMRDISGNIIFDSLNKVSPIFYQ